MAFRKKKTARKSIRTAYVRRYPDTGQRTAHVEWNDGSWTSGDPDSLHMRALLGRAEREGVRVLRYDLPGGSRAHSTRRRDNLKGRFLAAIDHVTAAHESAAEAFDRLRKTNPDLFPVSRGTESFWDAITEVVERHEKTADCATAKRRTAGRR